MQLDHDASEAGKEAENEHKDTETQREQIWEKNRLEGICVTQVLHMLFPKYAKPILSI